MKARHGKILWKQCRSFSKRIMILRLMTANISLLCPSIRMAIYENYNKLFRDGCLRNHLHDVIKMLFNLIDQAFAYFTLLFIWIW